MALPEEDIRTLRVDGSLSADEPAAAIEVPRLESRTSVAGIDSTRY
jgi:hypothetical protein